MMTGILNFLVSMMLLAPISEPAHGVGEIEVAPGFEVQEVASEPAVMDPVDFDWGPDGKLWVVEMADYPMGIDGKGSPCGRIKLLEDRDQDGI
ncbi:MAG: hypothetical protein KDA78_18615, partial [Planctomycetaceae bacterium]|nr:hypothetical protein [Planctomycetaceae bacterium]